MADGGRMTLTGIRQRNGVLFVAVMLAHVILISAQVNSRSGVPLLETVTFGVFSEVQRTAAAIVGGVRRAWGGYVGLRGVRAENDALRHELDALQIRFQEERALAARTRQLESLLHLRNQQQLPTTSAEVIAAGASPDFRTVTIDRGTADGLRSNMPVIAPGGIVGRIVTPGLHAAKVQLLVDRNAAAGAVVERSRAQGVIVGSGEDTLGMEYVPGIADVQAGDVVVTSGIDGIYPKGFVVGRVESVTRGNGIYMIVRVRPVVEFRRLEEVLVVLTPPPDAAIEGAP
jgi:rod shape-determining protein MreC